MGKKSRVRRQEREPHGGAASDGDGSVGPRQPCPCGSGRRYKNCHGAEGGAAPVFVRRPFEGLSGECDLVALREYVATATAPVTVTGHEDRTVRLCGLLPSAAPGLVREDGEVWVGMQVQHAYRDPSRDIAAALELALAAESGDDVVLVSDPGDGPRLQDLLTPGPLAVEVHEGFDWWLGDQGPDGPEGPLAAALEQANAAVSPTRRLALSGDTAAYWADAGHKEFLRWAMPYDEDPLLDALARLHAAKADVLVPGAKLVGMFRAHGLLVPVWDLPAGGGPEALVEPAAAYLSELENVLGSSVALSHEERSARHSLTGRQLTLR